MGKNHFIPCLYHLDIFGQRELGYRVELVNMRAAVGHATATFGSVGAGSVTVDWTNSRTVGGVVFNSGVNYTLGSGGNDSLMLTNYSTSGVSGTALIDATGATGTSTNFLNCRLDLHDNVTIRSPSKPLIIGGAITGPGVCG